MLQLFIMLIIFLMTAYQALAEEAETMVPGEAIEEDAGYVLVPQEDYQNLADPHQLPWHVHHYHADLNRRTWQVRAEQAEYALLRIYAEQQCSEVRRKYPRGCGRLIAGSWESFECNVGYAAWCAPIKPAAEARENTLARCIDYRAILRYRAQIAWYEENGQADWASAGMDRYTLQTLENNCLSRGW